MRKIESRLRFIMKRMDIAVVSDPQTQQDLEKIYFGAWVELYSLEKDSEHHYRIVGQDELDPGKGYISLISPLSRALLGKQPCDVIRVETPSCEESFEVVDVSYHAPAEG